MSGPGADAGGDAGFTLIEVLVGFVIVTLGLTAFYAGIGQSYRQMAESHMRQEALGRAQSHLNALGHAIDLAPGISSGTYSNGQRWRLTVAEIAAATEAAAPRLVILDTFDRNNRLLTRLRTVKLAAIQQ